MPEQRGFLGREVVGGVDEVAEAVLEAEPPLPHLTTIRRSR